MPSVGNGQCVAVVQVAFFEKANFETSFSLRRFKGCVLASLRSSLPTYRKSEGRTGAIAPSLVPGLFNVLFGVRTQRFYPQMTS
jgi:hypothetical protein